MRPVVSLLALTLPHLARTISDSDQVAITNTDTDTKSTTNSDKYTCQHPPYKIQVLSSSPLVIYIKDFLTVSEREHLREVSKSSFRPSAVSHKSGKASPGGTHRTSKSTYLKATDDDAVVSCIEARALSFQGHDIQPSQLEPLQLVRYTNQNEYYRLHTDWFDTTTSSLGSSSNQEEKNLYPAAHKLAINGGNRLSSFFAYVYVRNDTTGEGTNFPLIHAPRSEKWCDVIDCDEPWERGVTFRPVEGNAIYWVNLDPDSGRGDHRTVHAGLPVTTGDKIGMNIWTRQVPMGEEARARFDEYPDV